MDIRFPILEEIQRAGGSIDYAALLNHINSSPLTTKTLLKTLVSENLISDTLSANSKVSLEPDGLRYLLQLKEDANEQRNRTANEHAQKEADNAKVIKNQKRQFRHDFFVAAFAAVFSSALTLLIEHFNQLVNIIMSFFHYFTPS